MISPNVFEPCEDVHSVTRTVTHCTRQLILAHFETAAAETQDRLGANREILARRLAIAGITESEWRSYELLWDKTEGGSGLHKGTRSIRFQWRRKRHGKFDDIRPGIYAVISHLLEASVPPLVLKDWYKADLREHYAIEDVPEFIGFALEWLARFNGLLTASCSYRELLLLVFECSDERGALWAAGLVELLDYLAIVQYSQSALDGYKLKFRADPAFVLATLFGGSTGVDGLDYLLFGGLWSPGVSTSISRENLTVLISGEPGVGKSTLALALATQVAARGGFALFFRFEPDESSVLRQVTHFYRKYLPFMQIVTQSGRILTTGEKTARPGVLMISDTPGGSPDQMFNAALALIGAHADGFRERLVVFDPITVTRTYDDATSWRVALADGSGILRATGCSVVYVAEKQDSAETAFDEYVTDVAFRLVRGHSLDGHSSRHLEIVKTRWQSSHRGEHAYSIESGSGFTIFPSSGAVADARRHRRSRVSTGTSVPLTSGIKGFDEHFFGPSTDEGPVAESRWWRTGSVTALIGPRGTLKTSFANKFVESLETNQNYTPCSILVSFSDDLRCFYQPLLRQMQREIPFGIRFDRPVGGADTDGRGPTVTYLFFGSGYLAPGHVLETIRQVIREKRKAQTPIVRAALTDLGNLSSMYPALHRDRIFVPTVCDLLRSENITQLLSYSSSEMDRSDYVLEQVRSGAENLIRFERLVNQGKGYVNVFVERSVDSSHFPAPAQAHERTSKGRREIVIAAPSLNCISDD